MKSQPSFHRNHGRTMVEVLVVLAVLCLLAGLLSLHAHKKKAVRRNPGRDASFNIDCVNHLKQVNLAFRIWANDHGDHYPQQVEGLAAEAERGNAAAIFQVMSNELNTPKILHCPMDQNRSAAKNFSDFNDQHLSYFVSLSTNLDSPHAILMGDDNLTIHSRPVLSGVFSFSTNDPVSWTQERHINHVNFGFADGSVQQATLIGFHQALVEGGLLTNRWVMP